MSTTYNNKKLANTLKMSNIYDHSSIGKDILENRFVLALVRYILKLSLWFIVTYKQNMLLVLPFIDLAGIAQMSI